MDVIKLKTKEPWLIWVVTLVMDGALQQNLPFMLANFQTSLLFLFQVGGGMLGAYI